MSKNLNIIKTSIPYIPIGRKLLFVDHTTKGDTKYYSRDISCKAWRKKCREGVPTMIVEHESLFIQTITIGTVATATRQEVYSCEYDLEERIDAQARQGINIEEDTLIFEVLETGARKTLTRETLTCSDLMTAIGLLWNHLVPPNKIVMSPKKFYELLDDPRLRFFTEISEEEKKTNPVWGTFKEFPIYVSALLGNKVFVLSNPELVGVIPIDKDVDVITEFEIRKIRDENLYYEILGAGVINDYSIVVINVIGADKDIETVNTFGATLTPLGAAKTLSGDTKKKQIISDQTCTKDTQEGESLDKIKGN